MEHTRLWKGTKGKRIALLSKFLNLRSANYSPNLAYTYFYLVSLEHSQAHALPMVPSLRSLYKGRAEEL